MKNHITKANILMMMATIITSMNLTGFAMVQDNLQNASLTPGENGPHTVTASTIDLDTSAPVIDALDIVIPYGTSIRPDEMGIITDDQDESPRLEIISVTEVTAGNGKNTTTAKGSSLAATASTASTVNLHETTTAVESVKETVTEETAVTKSPDVASDTSKASAAAGSFDSATIAASTEVAATAVTDESAATSMAAGETADSPTAGPGYLFSTLGQFCVVLKGTDKSGNESTKTITVTVTDSIPPVFDGLSERFSLTDKNKNAPDYLAGITASDEIDGDITEKIKVDDSKVQYGKAGSYNVTYSVSDSSGNEVISSTPVIINDTTSPAIILLNSDFDLFVTDKKPDYAAFVIATDTVDGDVKDSLSIDDSTVRYNQSGMYTAIVRALDKSGNSAEKTVNVNVTAGWITQDGKKYYYSPQDGHLYHSWSHIDEKLYYFDPEDGHMLTGLQNIERRQYLLDSKDGHMVTGWQTIGGNKYYFSPDDGHMYHDWSHIKDDLFYFDPDDGRMMTGLQNIDGGQYLLDSKDGHMVTGWQTIDDEKYYFSENDGHMYHDWSTIDGTEYYFDKSDGHMYTGRHYVDGEEYNFGTSGAATKVVQTRSSGNYNNSATKSFSSYSYIGNRNTRKFHRASCSSVSQMNEGNKVGFDSRSEAIDGGYSPCKRCKP